MDCTGLIEKLKDMIFPRGDGYEPLMRSTNGGPNESEEISNVPKTGSRPENILNRYPTYIPPLLRLPSKEEG